jgi:4-amino-4-deoxy-L-arabinose transferase-like glycosyltransferase
VNGRRIYFVTLIFAVLLACVFLLSYGFYSIDEESYTYLTKAMVEKNHFHFETDYSNTYSQLNRVHLSVFSNDKVYSVFPPGYPFLAVPFYFLFGIEGMQLANIFFTVLLVITFYLFVREEPKY